MISAKIGINKKINVLSVIKVAPNGKIFASKLSNIALNGMIKATVFNANLDTVLTLE